MSSVDIAIIGRSCLLPGASSPEELWDLVIGKRLVTSSVPEDRWRISKRKIMGTPEASQDRTWSDIGGYVRGFDTIFDPDGFTIPAAELQGLDPLFLWTLHTAREALRDAKNEHGDRSRVGAIFGNLSFPSVGMSTFAEQTWYDSEGVVQPQNRFTSSGPAAVLEKALNLGVGAFCLDAACASSLYAIKLACDQLRDGTADQMLAGAVNCVDDLFVHVGFCALQAMSKSGQTRPFHADADGLVPAEGAGFVLLKRLEDAHRDGDQIYGVIKGIGLSNDARGSGLLAPAEEGQRRALQKAYQISDIDPSTVSLLECHATGTPVGDAVEIASSSAIFKQRLSIGSLKANMGHLVTTAGVAGLIKVLEAMRHQTLPPSIDIDVPHSALQESSFRLLETPEKWESRGPRIAGISAFGFGGNNAHLVLSEYQGPSVIRQRIPPEQRKVAVVGLAARVGSIKDRHELVSILQKREKLQDSNRHSSRAEDISLELKGLRFPPNDLSESLGQQVMLLQIARDAVADSGLILPRERTGVLIGMEADPEIARYGARWRMNFSSVEERDVLIPYLTSAGVLGTMPNIPANRLNSQFDVGGLGYTISAGGDSGLVALNIAIRDISSGNLDVAVVGAVDLSCEPVHQRAYRLLFDDSPPADAAAVLILRPLESALADRNKIYAVLEQSSGTSLVSLGQSRDGDQIRSRFGLSFAADSMLQATLGILSMHHGIYPNGNSWRRTAIEERCIDLIGQSGRSICLRGFSEAEMEERLPPSRTIKTLPAHPRPVQANVEVSEPKKQGAKMNTRLPVPPKIPTITSSKQLPPQRLERVQVTPQSPRPQIVQPPVPVETSTQVTVASIHQEFIDQQAKLHQQFLDVRQNAMFSLLHAAQGVPNEPAQQSHGHAPLVNNIPPVVRNPPVKVPVTPQAVMSVGESKPVIKKTEAIKAQLPSKAAVQSVTKTKPQPIGLQLNREQLEIHASGAISEIYGDLFKPQDQYHRQVRMPEPPLLLADRVIGIDAVPGSMGKGTIWTESDISWDSWYLHQGHMPAGVMIESGQADLMLISWLGVDLHNKGERVYRLLGCELTYHDDLPSPGETLQYDIHIDGHAKQGDIRLIFFHYECEVAGEPRLTVQNGQAGFFTDEELANSAGCLWSPEDQELVENPRLDPPLVACQRQSFSKEQIRYFSEGNTLECFGEGFEFTQTHTRTPRIQEGKMCFLDRITHLEHDGGPWGRGYLRAEADITPDIWFFDGHFKNDSCMPGTLMFEGTLQTMAFYLASLGYTIHRDGWRFAPVPEEKFALSCRGQVIPSSRSLVYELFVEEVIDGPIPMLYADLLCTIDGLKAFHARRVGLRLIPDWPMNDRPELIENIEEPKRVAKTDDGFTFGYKSLLACAWGKPSDAFGKMYKPFDGPGRVARLPGPPYHFISRVIRVDGAIGGMEVGTEVEVEFDIPSDVWYFDSNGCRSMPYAVLLEAALQPCGWLASYVGSALTVDGEVCFRNLDGTGNLTSEIFDDCEVLRTVSKLTSISKMGGMIIEKFEVKCYLEDRCVYEMGTAFGFFPPETMENQVGLPTTDDDRLLLTESCDFHFDVTNRGQALFEANRPQLADQMLMMIDRITGLWPEGGSTGQGRIRGEKDVCVEEWFFKAHFFQDPVQPGSLGIEALLQLLQLFMLQTNMDEGIDSPRFEPLEIGRPLTWKYRGQVVPKNKLISSTLEIVEKGCDDRGPYAVATGSLWVDGKRIYEVENMGMRVVSTPVGSRSTRSFIIDPEKDSWVNDHCPTYTKPALPMMSLVDLLAQAAPSGKDIVAMKNIRIKDWLIVDEKVELISEVNGDQIRLLRADDQREVASAMVEFGVYSSTLEPLSSLAGEQAPNPYRNATLFHGSAFQILTSLILTEEGSSSILQADNDIPIGRLNPGLLDAATHGIPHDQLQLWDERCSSEKVAYPAWIPTLQFHGPTPSSGEVRCEVRPDGIVGSSDFPAFQIQLIVGEKVWVSLRLVEAAFPKGPLGSAVPEQRRDFLQGIAFVPNLRLSRQEGEDTHLSQQEIDASNWLPGTIAEVYGTENIVELAHKEHIAADHQLHPRWLPDALPLTKFDLKTVDYDDQVIVRGDPRGQLDISLIQNFWMNWFQKEGWPVEDLFYGLIEQFVDRVVLDDPEDFQSLSGQSVLYLANHQVGVESLIFSIVASGLLKVPTVTLAKIEHKETWLGHLISHSFQYPEIRDPKVITFFDREDKSSLARIIGELAAEMHGGDRSVMVHIEGTRSLSCQVPVQKMSGAFIDLALKVGIPIVPVRFVGGLPTHPLDKRIEFPIAMGKQDIYFGRAIQPADLAELHYGARKNLVIDAINSLGPSNEQEVPLVGDSKLDAQVTEWMQEHGATHEHATLGMILSNRERCSSQSTRLLAKEVLLDTPEDQWLKKLSQWLFPSD